MKRSIVLVLALGLLGIAPARAAGPVMTTLIGPRPLCCTDGIAYANGALYIDQAALDQIVRVDLATGDITHVADEHDDQHEQIVTPDDLWIDPLTGDLYTTEILAGGIRKIAPDGTRTRVLAGFQDQFAFPNSITGLRRPGQPLRLFLALIQFEPGRHAGIWEVDPNGIIPPRLVYGAVGNRDIYGTGLDAEAFVFDAQGKELYVPSTYGGEVLAVDVDAHTARTVWKGDGGTGIAVRFDLDGTLLYADQASGRILRLDPHGPAEQTPELVAQLLPGVDGIAVVPDGRIFTTNFQQGGLDVIETDGSARPFVPRSLNLPLGLAPLPDGRVAIADLGSVAYVHGDQIARPQMFIRDDLDIALGVAARGACDVYVTGFFRGVLQHLDACDPAAKRTEVVPRHSFGVPGDMAIEGNTAFIADLAGVVWRIDGLNGAAKVQPMPLATGLVNPSGIVVSDDRVYVSENLADQVAILDPATGLRMGTMGGFDHPEGLAMIDGVLYVLEEGGGRITRVDIDGSRSTLVEGLPTQIRGVEAVPVLNYYADLAVAGDGALLVSLPRTGELRRIAL